MPTATRSKYDIVISYRNADAWAQARLLYTELAGHFGSDAVFFEKKHMDWSEEHQDRVGNATVLLLLIREKQKWLGTGDDGSRALDDPDDRVRREIETARTGGKTVIPVFLGKDLLPAALPASLHFLHDTQACAVEEAHWDDHVARLCKLLEQYVPRPRMLPEDLETENTRLHLRDARNNLSNATFEAALESFRPAGLRNAVPEEVWPVAFELAFVFLQAGRKDEGVFALTHCVEHLRLAKQLPPPFPDETFPGKHDFPALLQFLRRCDPTRFRRLEDCYFPVMIPVEGGTFVMGDVPGDQEYDDETVHSVALSSFELADAPVTWQQYGLYCLAAAAELPHDEGWGRADRPVVNVRWYDAVQYANWLSQARGLRPAYRVDNENPDPNNESTEDDLKWTVLRDRQSGGFRLPTESEWEFAARERGQVLRFGHGKNIADPAEMNFNASEDYRKAYALVGEYRKRTTPVRHFPPNALGLYDLSGNVWEWCGDWYGEYPLEAQTDPAGATSGSHRVHRGGAWNSFPQVCRVAARNYDPPGLRACFLGFRLARTS